MVFSDEDLKRLKEICEENIPESGFNIARASLKALLARLEAAEKALEPHRDGCGVQTDFDCDCDMEDRLKAWRKAAGR